MFAAWGSWVARQRRPVFAVTLIAVLAAGVWGFGVFGHLSEGGYTDPASESARAADLVQSRLGGQAGDVVVIYTPLHTSIDDAVLSQRAENMMAALPADKVSQVDAYWPAKTARYASADRSKAVAVLTLAATDDAGKLADFRDIKDKLVIEGASSQIAGGYPLADASAAQSTRDLGRAEAVSLPIVLVLLLLIFGSLVAAALPVLVGGCAVLGSLGVLHLIGQHHDVNSFAVNVASLLGLGMAIDYGLFMVGRFREEQGFGRTPADAVRRTVATAGRTVVFSATLLMIALAGLLLFPQDFLKSLAYGGLSAVGLAALLSLTLLPAVLTLLGPRVDTLPVRLRKPRADRAAGTGWTRLSHVVLKVPILVALPIVAGLLVLALPITHVHFGENDERQLPAGAPARVAIETLEADFPALSSVGVQVVLQGPGGRSPDAKAMTAAVQRVPGITGVATTGSARDVVVLTATLAGKDAFSTSARDAVRGVRALTPPAGIRMLVGGVTARNVDSLDAIAHRLPLMVGLLIGATLILMFLAFGSVVLPVKAVVMSALSLSATFGVLIWIFEDGHGASLLNITPAPAEAGIVVLMAAVVFGLSTDYEVFLLSRMVEARTRGATTAEAVTTGLARTGRVISAAAVLLIVVTGAFALSSVTTMRFVGVGMIVALLLDATVVRMLLVPAVLGMLGDAAWWAPGPLRRLQEKAGLSEYAGEELFPTVSVGRHAAPGAAVSRSASTSRPRHASGSQPIVTGVVVAAAAAPPAALASASASAALAPVALPAGPAAGVPNGTAIERSGGVERSSGAIPLPAHGNIPALPAGRRPMPPPDEAPSAVVPVLPGPDAAGPALETPGVPAAVSEAVTEPSSSDDLSPAPAARNEPVGTPGEETRATVVKTEPVPVSAASAHTPVAGLPEPDAADAGAADADADASDSGVADPVAAGSGTASAGTASAGTASAGTASAGTASAGTASSGTASSGAGATGSGGGSASARAATAGAAGAGPAGDDAGPAGDGAVGMSPGASPAGPDPAGVGTGGADAAGADATGADAAGADATGADAGTAGTRIGTSGPGADSGMPVAGRTPEEAEADATQHIPAGAVRTTEDEPNPGVVAPAGDSPDPAATDADLHARTVDLASHLKPAADREPTPDATAVLEYDETVDLSGRLHPRSEDSRSR